MDSNEEQFAKYEVVVCWLALALELVYNTETCPKTNKQL